MRRVNGGFSPPAFCVRFFVETRAPAKPLEMGEGQAFILESLKKGGQNARRKFALWFSPSVFATLSAGV
jgi:hypothetical protein